MIHVAIGADSRTHYYSSDARPKGCGRVAALCGREVDPNNPEPEGTEVSCWHCEHSLELGEPTAYRFKKSVKSP